MNHTSSISSLGRKLAAAFAAVLPATVALAGLGPISGASAAPVSFDLCATAGTSTAFPSGTTATSSLSFWGYADADATGCTAATVAHPGGRTLEVNEGDTVTIHLHNNLPETTSLDIGGQGLLPDRTGAGTGASTDYTFTATRPGTFLYQAGLTANSPQEIGLGLYGALVVHPTTAGQAYSDAGSAYDTDSVLVLSELDPALNPGTYAGFDMRNFAPKWGLINGVPFPNTAPIPATADDTVLLRYVNAGSLYHSMSVLGANQTQIATDGHRLGIERHFVAETFGPGETADVLVHVPAATPDGAKLTVFEGSTSLFNNGKKTNLATARAFGGMMTQITVGNGATPTDTTGPLVTSVGLVPNPAASTTPVTMTFTASDPSTVTAAEYKVDNAAIATTVPAFTAGNTVTISVPNAAAGATAGNHTVQVRAQDALGNWGTWSSAALVLDDTGPAIDGLTLSPNPSNGSNVVIVHAAATDPSRVTEAEYRIDGGTVAAFTVTPGTTVNLDSPISGSTTPAIPTLPVSGSFASHPVEVRAKDSAGNWSAWSPIDLVLDLKAPAVASSSWQYLNQTPPPARITATFDDSAAGGSKVVQAQGRIDTTGTGFEFLPSSGTWNTPVATAYGDIPPATLTSLAPGDHTLYVRGRDAAGNWSEWSAVPGVLTVASGNPTVTSATAVMSTTTSRSATLTIAATSPTTGINRAEYFIGTDPGPGVASVMSVTPANGTSVNATATFDVTAQPEGPLTISVRVRNASGAWSPIRTTTVNVTHPYYFTTNANVNAPGVTGTADDADILRGSGPAFSRYADLRVGNAGPPNVPANANVDGIQVFSATSYCVSFTGTVNLGSGTLSSVQDEDIVCRNGNTWTMKFDGSARGLTNNQFDIDDFTFTGFGTVSEKLYFSLDNNRNPTVSGFPQTGTNAGDDADIYTVAATGNTFAAYAKVWDATNHGLVAGDNVIGLSILDATHFFVALGADTDIADYGGYSTGDILYYNNGVWTLYATTAALIDPNTDLTYLEGLHVS